MKVKTPLTITVCHMSVLARTARLSFHCHFQNQQSVTKPHEGLVRWRIYELSHARTPKTCDLWSVDDAWRCFVQTNGSTSQMCIKCVILWSNRRWQRWPGGDRGIQRGSKQKQFYGRLIGRLPGLRLYGAILRRWS